MEIVPNPRILWIPGVSCSSFPILCGQSAVVVSNRGIVVPNFIFVSPNSKLGAQFPVWGPSFAFGDNIRQVGTTFCILWPQIQNWASIFPFGDKVSNLGTTLAGGDRNVE